MALCRQLCYRTVKIVSMYCQHVNESVYDILLGRNQDTDHTHNRRIIKLFASVISKDINFSIDLLPFFDSIYLFLYLFH